MRFHSRTISAAVLIALTSASGMARASDVCPDVSMNETTQDCPWAGVARTLVEDAEAGRPVAAHLKTLLPEVYQQIEADGRQPAIKALWGQSINFDEGAKGIILHPMIYSSLTDVFGVAHATPMPTAPMPNERIVHAGLEHTYGYLFSILNTSFGYKRARWVQGDIERGFGLPAGLIGPAPAEGTLLSNISSFLAPIALRDEQAHLAEFRQSQARRMPKAIAGFDYAKLSPVRLVETVALKGKNGPRTVRLFTDFVPFTHGGPYAASANSLLLIYGVSDTDVAGGTRLISAFPVSLASRTMDNAIAPTSLGPDKAINSRYNAYVEGMTGTPQTGSRLVYKGAKENDALKVHRQ